MKKLIVNMELGNILFWVNKRMIGELKQIVQIVLEKQRKKILKLEKKNIKTIWIIMYMILKVL